MLSRLLIVASVLWSTSAFASLYAAIAYSSQSGRYGYSAGASSPQEAANGAVRGCAAYDCQVAGLVENGFVAISVNRRGEVFEGTSTSSKEQAIGNANFSCRQQSRRGCSPIAWAGAYCAQAATPNYPPVGPAYPSTQPSYQQGSGGYAPIQEAPSQYSPPRQSAPAQYAPPRQSAPVQYMPEPRPTPSVPRGQNPRPPPPPVYSTPRGF